MINVTHTIIGGRLFLDVRTDMGAERYAMEISNGQIQFNQTKKMTDRIKALTVSLRADMRDDDCEAIVNAIMMIKGVTNVTKHVEDWEHILAIDDAKRSLTEKLWEVLK